MVATMSSGKDSDFAIQAGRRYKYRKTQTATTSARLSFSLSANSIH